MKKIGILIMVLALAFGFSSVLCAQSQAGKKEAGEKMEAGKKPVADRAFITDALSGGIFEVEMGKVALEKASNDEVKQYAQRMVDDHSKAGDELRELASSKGMDPPQEMKKKHRDMFDKLSKLSGAAFDKAYLNHMVKDHKEDVSAFRKEAKQGKDPEVKAWASKTLPTLEEHLKMARDLSKKVTGMKQPAPKK